MFNVHAHAGDYIIKAAHCYIDLVAHTAILIYSLMHDHVANCHYCPYACKKKPDTCFQLLTYFTMSSGIYNGQVEVQFVDNFQPGSVSSYTICK